MYFPQRKLTLMSVRKISFSYKNHYIQQTYTNRFMFCIEFLQSELFCDSVSVTRYKPSLEKVPHIWLAHNSFPLFFLLHCFLFFLAVIVTCKSWEQGTCHLLKVEDTHVKLILKTLLWCWQYVWFSKTFVAKRDHLS